MTTTKLLNSKVVAALAFICMSLVTAKIYIFSPSPSSVELSLCFSLFVLFICLLLESLSLTHKIIAHIGYACMNISIVLFVFVLLADAFSASVWQRTAIASFQTSHPDLNQFINDNYEYSNLTMLDAFQIQYRIETNL
ncbi:hypothetical protein A3715_18125 [Oleiphilus sp. HI0009]|nr:hypothetical protein A3715_18125 [Oleiphilus sp. HI0009]